MSILLTRPGKTELAVDNPVIAAAGTMGNINAYKGMVNLKKLGAIITNPVSYYPRKPAVGVRVVPLSSGVLVNTGLPNAGTSAEVKRLRRTYDSLGIPLIMHLIATTPEEVGKAMRIIDTANMIVGVELGLPDDISWQDAAALTEAAIRQAEKPVIVRLPLYDAYEIAQAVADVGAGALVVAAPPRGIARDPISGSMVTGQVYSPTTKTMALHLVNRLKNRIKDIPVIGAGGIHTQQDARDYMEAGTVAVQVDSVTWVLPRMIEIIARDLGGMVITREQGALADEWFTGIGQTDVMQQKRDPYDD
jgi:dihydroorotate dehydrogenase (NAD+) catalytic subunit